MLAEIPLLLMSHKKKPHLHEGEKGMDPQISPKDGSDMSHFLAGSPISFEMDLSFCSRFVSFALTSHQNIIIIAPF